ncbi:hypothetical protein [uncultured Microbacterium sp.]|uniref:hypothetical protein n=1 Tax=uncultured Microbacterium sp. TaxID=191216 RepID=UPI002629AEA6|nr:hypothetical protein [uncultured Microbacterium sp.]
MIIKRASFAAVAATALLLAGCSGGGSSDAAGAAAESASPSPASSSPAPASTEASSAATGEQSAQEACQIIISSFNDVTTASSEISTSDPQAAVTRFKELASKVQSDFSQITNGDIAPAAQNASQTLDEYVTFLEGVMADPSTASGLGDQVTALQESFTQAGTACAG